MDRKQLESIVLDSFMTDIKAFKPGNVSIYSAGFDMHANDFIKSAEAVSPCLCQPGSSLGQRVIDSVQATQQAAYCNTNLGMLLLFAPLIIAAESDFSCEQQLHDNLKGTLNTVHIKDTEQIFRAICLANPGGLGRVRRHDVHHPPDGALLDIMKQACSYDFIALQYCNAFTHIFNQGLSCIRHFVKRWNSIEWAVVACYLMYLSTWEDSHIRRKYGQNTAEKIKITAKEIARQFNIAVYPNAGVYMLRDYDRVLKNENYNPGTSADLTVASLLVYNLIKQNVK